MIRNKPQNTILSLVLALLTAASAIASLSILILPTMGEPGSLPQVIWNYPSNVDPDDPDLFLRVPLNQLNWNKKEYHSGYDGSKGAYTDKTSRQYNGVATKDHVVLTGNAVRFLGYGINNNLDLIYTTAYDAFEVLHFTLDPVRLRFHTLNQTGFLFNGSFDAGNNYTGYALVVDSNGEVKKNEKGTAALKLVYMEGQLFQKAAANSIADNNFPYPGGFGFAWEDIIVDPIVESVSTAFDVTLYRSKTGFSLYIDGNLVREIEPAGNMNQGGFGLFAGYYKHDCSVLTVMEYSNLSITVKLPLGQAGCEVRFIDKDTGLPVADAQTVPRNLAPGEHSYIGDEYLVNWELAQTITGADGETYQFVFSDRDDMTRIAYNENPADNITTLYYKNAALMPEKHASIDGGVTWENGSEENPVHVAQGDIIDYRVDIKTPPETNALKTVVFHGANPRTETADKISYPLSALTASSQHFVTAGSSSTNLFNPPNLSVASFGSPEPYLINYYVWNPTNTSNNRSFAQYLWLEAPGLAPGEYNVSVCANLEFRAYRSNPNSYTSRNHPISNLRTYFKGILTDAQSYGAYNSLAAHEEFTDVFMTDLRNINGGSSGREAGYRWEMPANISQVTWSPLNVNNATDYPPPHSTRVFTGKISIGNDGNGVIGLSYSGGGSLDTASADRFLTVIRVYAVRLEANPHHYTLTDLLPEGVELADDLPDYYRIESEDHENFDFDIVCFEKDLDEETGRELLTWDFLTLRGGTTSIYFKARVTAVNGLFENAAYVQNHGSPLGGLLDRTNSTWHECNMVKVTERYRNYLNQTQELKDDTHTWVGYGEGYGVAPYLRDPISKSAKTYRYYAYSTDGGATIIYDIPPDGMPWEAGEEDEDGESHTDHAYAYLWDEVLHNNNEVILYFIEDVAVAIHFVERSSGTELKTFVDYGVRGGVPYILPPSCLASFLYGGEEYNYINLYNRNGGFDTLGSPPLPAFTAIEMMQNNQITLYFAKDPKITIRFVIMENDAITNRLLKNSLTEIVPYLGDYDPGLSAHQPLDTVLTHFVTGKAYRFAGYRLDDGAITLTNDINELECIEGVNKNHTYTLLFVEKPLVHTLHLRQVVLGYEEPAAALPYTGYFNLLNNGKIYSMTTDSSRDGLHVNFRDIVVTFSDEDEMEYFIHAIVPQYYVYDGFMFSEEDTAHDPEHRSGDPASVDFAGCTDFWVTVYIRPLPNPGKHSWDMKPNDFGTINLAP